MSHNDNKSIDGIKKLNKEELKKSRKVVLDLIGEKAEIVKPKNKLSTEKKFKKVDGIFGIGFKKESKNKTAQDKSGKQYLPQITEAKKEQWHEKIKNIMPESALAPDFIKVGPAMDSLSQPKRKTVLMPTVSQEVRKQENKKAKKQESKKTKKSLFVPTDIEVLVGEKVAQDGRKNEKVRKQLKKKKGFFKKNKLAEKKARMKKARIAAKKNKQEKRINRIKKVKINFLNFLIKFLYQLKVVWLKLIYIFLAGLLLAILFYSVLAVLILRLEVDTGLTRRISRYFPVPALITNGRMVAYYDYKDMKAAMADHFSVEHKLEQAVKLNIAKIMILKDLAERYNLSVNDFNSENLKEQLADKIVFDDKVNQVAIKRIKKIKQMMDENGDFVRMADKYGDEQGQVDVTKKNEDSLIYSHDVKDLEVDQISDIVITPEGYYIFRCYGKTEESIGLSYVFIRAMALDEYIYDAAKSLKIWSLVD